MKTPINKGFLVNCGNKEEDDFFQKWVEYTRPKHGLTKTEQRVLAGILRHRYELSKSISDQSILEETFLNKIHRDIVRKSLGMSCPQFNGIIGKLIDNKIISKNKITDLYRIDPNFIVNPDETGEFKLMMIFKYKPYVD